RYAKRLWTDRSTGPRPQLVSVEDEMMQARWVADQVLAHREGGLALKSQAVLFRTASHSAAPELELIRRNIPFVRFAGRRSLEAAHIKDLLSLLRWVENPRSRLAGFRIAQLVQGIGPASARKLLDAMDASPDPHQALLDFKPPAAAGKAWSAFRETWLALRKEQPPWPQERDRALRGYQPQLERLHEDATVRLADLAQLARIASGHASRERFLTELTLD